MNGKARFSLAIAQGFGLGKLPKMPGTWASMATAMVLGLLTPWSPWPAIFLAGLATLGGLWVSGQAAKSLGEKDPSSVVIDEIAGQSIALIGATSPWHIVFGFLAFRLLDILKPWPVCRLEKLPGSFGIMADDLAAGAMAWAVVWGIKVWV